jgi:hypothetical protein
MTSLSPARKLLQARLDDFLLSAGSLTAHPLRSALTLLGLKVALEDVRA